MQQLAFCSCNVTRHPITEAFFGNSTSILLHYYCIIFVSKNIVAFEILEINA